MRRPAVLAAIDYRYGTSTTRITCARARLSLSGLTGAHSRFSIRSQRLSSNSSVREAASTPRPSLGSRRTRCSHPEAVTPESFFKVASGPQHRNSFDSTGFAAGTASFGHFPLLSHFCRLRTKSFYARSIACPKARRASPQSAPSSDLERSSGGIHAGV